MTKIRLALLTLLAAGALTGCTNTDCPTPIKNSDGTYTVAKMSKACEKKLIKYSHHDSTAKKSTRQS